MQLPLPLPIDDPPHRLVWLTLQHAAASPELQMKTFDGTLLLVSLGYRTCEEHTAPLLDDLATWRLIRAWAILQPSENSFPDGNPHGKHRCCILVTQHQRAALLQKQGAGP